MEEYVEGRARVPIGLYKAFETGNAFNNNGVRAKDGTYYPEQPIITFDDPREERFKDAAVEIGIEACSFIAFQIVLPEIKRFTREKIYPMLAEKWDGVRAKNKEKKLEKAEKKVEDRPANVIEMPKMVKMA